MWFVGVTGGTLLALSLLEKKGYSINEGMIRFSVESAKYGLLLYLAYQVWKVFL
jgi:hypothetical protein